MASASAAEHDAEAHYVPDVPWRDADDCIRAIQEMQTFARRLHGIISASSVRAQNHVYTVQFNMGRGLRLPPGASQADARALLPAEARSPRNIAQTLLDLVYHKRVVPVLDPLFNTEVGFHALKFRVAVSGAWYLASMIATHAQFIAEKDWEKGCTQSDVATLLATADVLHDLADMKHQVDALRAQFERFRQ